MVDLIDIKRANAERWAKIEIRPSREVELREVAAVLVHWKNRFTVVETLLQKQGYYVPWWFIAIVGYREAGPPPRLFQGQLGQGDPLGEVSRHVPAGRGPFFGVDAWERSCLDALIDCAPHSAKNDDWSPGGTAVAFIKYNGLGYDEHGLVSPYAWSGSTAYVKGKYVRDGVLDRDVVDAQMGCMPILYFMMQLDHTIGFDKSHVGNEHSSLPKPAPVPPIEHKTAPVSPVTPVPAAPRPWWLLLLDAFRRL